MSQNPTDPPFQRQPPSATPAATAPTRPPPAAQAGPPEESELWSANPSHVLGSDWYALGALSALGGLVGVVLTRQPWFLLLVALGLGLALWKYLALVTLRYTLTTERLLTAHGILTRRTDHVELYRIKDSVLIEPFWLRLCGAGNIELTTSDASTPKITLTGIDRPRQVWDLIRRQVEHVREHKGVTEIDVE